MKNNHHLILNSYHLKIRIPFLILYQYNHSIYVLFLILYLLLFYNNYDISYVHLYGLYMVCVNFYYNNKTHICEHLYHEYMLCVFLNNLLVYIYNHIPQHHNDAILHLYHEYMLCVFLNYLLV